MCSREAEEFLASRENTSAGGTAWERIAKLVDLSDKGARAGKSDKTRFREYVVLFDSPSSYSFNIIMFLD